MLPLATQRLRAFGASKPWKGYVGLLAAKIAEVTSRPVHIINLGVNGAKVQDVIDKQIPLLQKLKLPSDVGSNS